MKYRYNRIPYMSPSMTAQDESGNSAAAEA